MRFRVDLRSGWASFGEQDEAKAWALYHAEGLRISACEDLDDEKGIVLAGVPHEVDVSPKRAREVA